MEHDRLPHKPVVVDELMGVEEMEVTLYLHEIKRIAGINFARRVQIEPWVRVKQGVDMELACGVNVFYPEEDDGA